MKSYLVRHQNSEMKEFKFHFKVTLSVYLITVYHLSRVLTA